MTRSSRALVEVHVAALLYGFIGPFGKAVDLNPHEIVFWRTSLAAVVLLAIARRLKSHTLVKNWADLATFTAIAGLLAVHWVLFFKSIKVSTVAIGLVTTYTYPVLMVFLESWFFNLRLRALDFASAVAVAVGTILVLEVVYGVILALVFLAAVPSKREVIGGLIIVTAALFESLRSRGYGIAKRDISESEG